MHSLRQHGTGTHLSAVAVAAGRVTIISVSTASTCNIVHSRCILCMEMKDKNLLFSKHLLSKKLHLSNTYMYGHYTI